MILCFDIGGTSIKYGLAQDNNDGITFYHHWETPTDAKILGGSGIQTKVLALIQTLRERYTFSGIAISTAGMVDHRTGAILYANDNIPGYTGVNLKTAVQDTFGLPCTVENDVNCAALGEAFYGAGRGADSIVCMTVGTGIGAAIVLDGKIWHGHSGSAGEIGYLPFRGDTLEKGASTTSLIQNVSQRLGKTLDGKQIFMLAAQGNTVCQQAIDDLCSVLAQAITICTCLLDPEVIVLGGGIMAQRDTIRPLLLKHLERVVNPFVLSHIKVDFASYGNLAGMAGAYRYFNQCMA